MSDLLLAVDQHQLALSERYTLNGTDELIRFTSGKNVHLTIEADHCSRERDSSRVQSRMLSDYKWDVSQIGAQHSERLLAVHGPLIAYRLCQGVAAEAVRVMERETRNRQLIKEFRAPIVDLQWCRYSNLLAVLDASCNVYIYHVEEPCTVEKYQIILWREDENAPDTTKEEKEKKKEERPKLVWCPYIPEDADPSDQCTMFAITRGNEVHLINLSVLKAAKREVEVDLNEAKSVEGAVLAVTVSNKIRTLCLSPDATAVAIGDDSGVVSFYIIDSNQLRFAHNWTPQMTYPLAELFFLDNINAMEHFWRYCVAVDAEGRSLTLFECENWTCIGRLKMDSPLKLSKFTVQVDPHARYVYLVDIHGANVFCIELDYCGGTPLFSSITQICFYHPLVAVAPFDVKDADSADFSFDEDDITSPSGTGGTKPGAEVHVSMVAISPRSVLLLDVSLEKSEPRENPSEILLRSTRESQLELLSALGIIPATSPSAILTQYPSSSTPQQGSKSTPTSEPHAHHSAASSVETTVATGIAREQHEALMAKLNDMADKMDELSTKVERAEEERKTAATNESILEMMRQFKEEFTLREDRLLAHISDLMETGKAATVSVVRNALNENSLAVETSIQTNSKIGTEALLGRLAEKNREALSATVIPSLERLCTQLFKQLNEHFRQGVSQYLAQVRLLQAATLANTVSTPAPVCQDRQALLNLIKNGQMSVAFENVLNEADEVALQFVCQNVDPDELFSSGGRLGQHVMLSLLQQLSYNLESDTELKFRYMEHILVDLNAYDDTIVEHVPKVLNMVVEKLNEFLQKTTKNILRRQARMIIQLSAKLMQVLRITGRG